MDRKMVEGKLRRMEKFLRELEHAERPENYAAFSKNVVFKRFVERNIELSIEQMIDTCRHIVSALDLRQPESYADCFGILAEANVIPTERTEVFQQMARFRNLLIHGYDGVDDAITFGVYTKHLDDFRAFIGAVREYMAGRA